MPDTRERLIELLDGVLTTEDVTASEKVADHLIANGVTFGKPLTEYLHPVDAYEGLKGKYLVFKADTGEQVVNCFVLRPDKDTAAMEALRAYAHTTDNKMLANDIYNWVGKGVTVQKWIPVTERLPEEHDSIFAKLYGTEKWVSGMFRTTSNDVNACVEYEDGTRQVKTLCTLDGKWNLKGMGGKESHPLDAPARAAERRMNYA